MRYYDFTYVDVYYDPVTGGFFNLYGTDPIVISAPCEFFDDTVDSITRYIMTKERFDKCTAIRTREDLERFAVAHPKFDWAMSNSWKSPDIGTDNGLTYLGLSDDVYQDDWRNEFDQE